ncbi:hypothetical protein K0B03_04560, partial [Patescibacteria group bacterium]|nr:hypothetical protein [Patescibacteria group bacterium]
MKNTKNIAILFFLFLIVFSFSGCLIKKVEEGKENIDPKLPQDIRKTDLDSDKDGLFDDEENLYGTDINKADTDDDGLSDFLEIRNWKTNP